MKPGRAVTPRKTGRCQRDGCPNVGALRSDMYQKKWAIFLCNTCFDSLQVYQLKQLFKEFGTPLRKSRESR